MGGSMTTIRKYKENGNLLPQQQLFDFFTTISKEIVDLKVKAIKESRYFCITLCLPLPQNPLLCFESFDRHRLPWSWLKPPNAHHILWQDTKLNKDLSMIQIKMGVATSCCFGLYISRYHLQISSAAWESSPNITWVFLNFRKLWNSSLIAKSGQILMPQSGDQVGHWPSQRSMIALRGSNQVPILAQQSKRFSLQV